MRWDPPGKGDWRGLHDHFPRALTPEYELVLATGMAEGEAVYFANYGLPAKTLQPAFVNGRVFVTAAPLVGPPSNHLPPAPLLWLAVRLVPAFRRRATAARDALFERRWLAEAASWYEVERPAWHARNAALDATEPGDLGDDDLRAHLLSARANVAAGYHDHFRLHGTDLIPTALFLVRADDWGIDPIDAASLLTGSSPASRRVDADLPSWRLVTGYDLDDLCACELPARVAGPRHAPAVDGGYEEALRGRVPRSRRPEWDDLLADARATYGVRDDNALFTAAWPMGLLRRAMLEAGRRLAGLGRLHDPRHAIEVTVAELVELLAGATDPTADEVAARGLDRRLRSSEVPPPTLGRPLELPVDSLPAAMRFMTRGLVALRDLGTTPPDGRVSLRGVGIGDRAVVGRACVADDPAEALARFEPGDVIVTRATCPMWNALLALAGGIVTEEGGPLSHAAVIARELGLPAVIGSPGAVALVPDGAEIEVNPIEGLVRIAGDAPSTEEGP